MQTAEYFLEHKCPLEWDDGLQINIKEYQDLERNNSVKKQKELVKVTVTAAQLMQKIADTAQPVMKHLWQSWWGSHQRRYDYNTFTYGMVRYKADFSATLDNNPQYKLNCAISAHAIQNVMRFSLLSEFRDVTNKSGLTYRKRFIRNIGFNFWACGNYSLSNNYYFHYKCLAWAIEYLQRRFGKDAVKYMVGYTDGYPDQYKSRLDAIMVGDFCDAFGFEEYVHHFAPTASFRKNVNLSVVTQKRTLPMAEKREIPLSNSRGCLQAVP